MKKICILLASLFSAGVSHATGTVTASVKTIDQRANAYIQAGCTSATPSGRRQSFANGVIVPGEEMLVQLRAFVNGLEVESKYTMTDSLGAFSLSWATAHQTGLTINVRVFPERPLLNPGQVVTWKPSHEFRIGDGSIVLSSLNFASTGNNQAKTLTHNVAGEHMMAYLTTLGVYTMYTQEGGIRSSIGDVSIHVNSATNVTPTTNDVFILTGDATDDPWVISHEMGHIFLWRGWGS